MTQRSFSSVLADIFGVLLTNSSKQTLHDSASITETEDIIRRVNLTDDCVALLCSPFLLKTS